MRRWAGFAILTIFIGVFFGVTLLSAWRIHVLAFISVAVFAFFAMVAIVNILRHIPDLSQAYSLFSKNALKDFLAVFAGGMLTYALSVFAGVNVVLASGISGVLAALFYKPYAVAVFCGSFIGMSSPELLSPLYFLMAALAASFIFVLTKDVYNGVGGKLGTIALSGVFVISLIINQPFLPGASMDEHLILWVVLFGIVGAVGSNVLNIRLSQGAVMGSAFIGVVFGGFLPLIFGDQGLMLAIVAFGASFAGMASRTYLKNEGWTFLAGILFALLFIYSAQDFGGVGGKLGTIAFASVLSVKGLYCFVSHDFKSMVQSK